MGGFAEHIAALEREVIEAGELLDIEAGELLDDAAIVATDVVAGVEDALSAGVKSIDDDWLKEQFVDASIRAALGPFAHGLGALPTDAQERINSAVQDLLTNVSSFVLGFANGLEGYAQDKEATELAEKLIDLYGELVTPDDDGIFLLRKSFFKGLYDGLDAAIGGAMELANGLADFLALPSVRGKVSESLKAAVAFLFGKSSEELGDHAELSYVVGYQAGMAASQNIEQTIEDPDKFATSLGSAFSTVVVEIAIEKGVFKVVGFAKYADRVVPVLRARQLGAQKLAPGIDTETRSMIDRLPGAISKVVWKRTGSTNGITRFRVRESFVRTAAGNGHATEVHYAGVLLPAMPRSRKKALSKIFERGSSPPIAPNYNRREPAVLLKPRLFVDGNGKPNLRGRWQRAHTYGPGWGDEGGAGIWLAQYDINQIIQNVLTENIGRRLRDAAKKMDGKAEVEVTTRSFPKELLPDSYQAELANHPNGAFLMDAEYVYRATNSEGNIAEIKISFTLNAPPDGSVKSFNTEIGDLDNQMNKDLYDALRKDFKEAKKRLNAAKT